MGNSFCVAEESIQCIVCVPLFRRSSCQGFRSKVPLFTRVRSHSCGIKSWLCFFYLQYLRRSHWSGCDSCLLSHKFAKFRKRGIFWLETLSLESEIQHPSSGSSSTSHLSTILLHLATMWVGSFLIIFWFLSGSLRTFPIVNGSYCCFTVVKKIWKISQSKAIVWMNLGPVIFFFS